MPFYFILCDFIVPNQNLLILNAEYVCIVRMYNIQYDLIYVFETGFVKRGLPHTLNLATLMIHNFKLLNTTVLKFGQQEAPT